MKDFEQQYENFILSEDAKIVLAERLQEQQEQDCIMFANMDTTDFEQN